MKIEVDVSKRALYFFIGIFTVIMALIGVNAWGGNSPNIMGHSLGEIGLPVNTPNLIVDTTPADGFIDNVNNAANAANSNKVGGLFPSDFSKRCNSVYTGLNGDNWKGRVALSLLVGGENICEDGDGCEFRVVRRVSDLSNRAIWDNDGHIRFHQFESGNGEWVSTHGDKKGKNGDSNTKLIAEWYTDTQGVAFNPSTRVYFVTIEDDDSTTGPVDVSKDYVTIRDRSYACVNLDYNGNPTSNPCSSSGTDYSFVVSVCD